MAPRQLTDVAKSKRTFERNQFRHAKVNECNDSITPSYTKNIRCETCLSSTLRQLLTENLVLYFCRVEKATDDTMRSWSSTSTLARVHWAQARLDDKNVLTHCDDCLHFTHHAHLGGDNKCVRILFLYIRGFGAFKMCGCTQPSIKCRPHVLFSLLQFVLHILRSCVMVTIADVDTVKAAITDGRMPVLAATLVNNKHYRTSFAVGFRYTFYSMQQQEYN